MVNIEYLVEGRETPQPRHEPPAGLGLASLGVYGVIARTLAQRTGEFGIRLALGARARDVILLVLTSGAKLARAGCSIGLLGAFGVAGLLAARFPGMQMTGAPPSLWAPPFRSS